MAFLSSSSKTCVFVLALSAAITGAGCDAALTGVLSDERSETLLGPGEEEPEAPAVRPELPGFSVIRRLNRDEYQNTTRDLLGSELDVTGGFPADDLGGEFATVGTSLSLSPLYVMAYERAAHDLVSELFDRTDAKRDEILSCDVEAFETEVCAKEIVGTFARRAFRRPLFDGELDGLLGPYNKAIEVDATKTEGLRHSLAAVLLSPHFLFKVEADEVPDTGAVRALNSHEIATRLSYALWATMPDEALFARADAGDLVTDDSIEEEIERMLNDERADGFLEGFFAHWLKFNHLEDHEVEPTAFPDYDPELAVSMKEEARLFFSEFLSSDRPASELLSANFTFVDDLLAAHYGLPGPGSDAFVRVETVGSTRGGLLTLGALLMTTSFSSRTSVVVRGAYVFDHLLCGEIPPPPPGVEGLAFDTEGLTQRERLDLHRQDPSCSSCHNIMDPLGFGLENYDAVGAYRELDGTLPVDASGELPDGQSFSGAIELGQVLADDPRFPECVTQKFMTYALGRVFSTKDDWRKFLTQELRPKDGSLRTILREVLLSDAFRTRQAGSGAAEE